MGLVAQDWMTGVAVVALIIFCETGLVVLPFLPGDSLLFSTGALLGIGGVSPAGAIAMCAVAAILGDSANYLTGKSALGQSIVRHGWIKSQRMQNTREFFDRYGTATIAMGRFVPIVRTVAPFVAGLSDMDARRFLAFNVLGGVVWSSSMLLAGCWLGGVPWVRDHIEVVMMGIVILSLLPVVHFLSINRRSPP